jgi:hypothetical protein
MLPNWPELLSNVGEQWVFCDGISLSDKQRAHREMVNVNQGIERDLENLCVAPSS